MNLKNLIIAASMLLGFTGLASAQTAPAKATNPSQKMEAKKGGKMEAKTSSSTTSGSQTTTTSSKQTATTGTPVKKDGTPDKRFKANQTTTTTATTHVKKDGTPDKRYKENKKSQ